MDTIIAVIALVVSAVSLAVTYRSTRHQIISTILSHLTDKSAEINTYIQNRLDSSQKGNYEGFSLTELDISHIGTNVVSSRQLLDLHYKKHDLYLSLSDKQYIVNSYYLQLHATIRTKLWEPNENSINNTTIKQQLIDSKEFLKEAKSTYK